MVISSISCLHTAYLPLVGCCWEAFALSASPQHHGAFLPGIPRLFSQTCFVVKFGEGLQQNLDGCHRGENVLIFPVLPTWQLFSMPLWRLSSCPHHWGVFLCLLGGRGLSAMNIALALRHHNNLCISGSLNSHLKKQTNISSLVCCGEIRRKAYLQNKRGDLKKEEEWKQRIQWSGSRDCYNMTMMFNWRFKKPEKAPVALGGYPNWWTRAGKLWGSLPC